MKTKKEKKAVFPFSITPSVIKNIEAIATENDRSRSSQVEIALKKFITESNKKTA